MSNFNGLVRAKKEDLDKAVSNWDKAYSEADAIRKKLSERSMVETLTSKYPWMPEEVGTLTVYEYILKERRSGSSFETFENGLQFIYPSEFTHNVYKACESYKHLINIKAMLNINPDELYLSSEQAVKVVEWRDYDQT
jgi:hypothetical protein